MKKSASSKTAKSNLSLDSANQVTSLSKVLAAALFISLPFVGFILGFNYQNELNAMYSACMNTATDIANMGVYSN